MSDFIVGELVRITTTFTNSAGAIADPDDVFFDYKNSEGTLTELVYLTDAALVREEEGIFHVDINANQPGTWQWYFYSTGEGQSATKGCFTVASQWEAAACSA